MQEDSLKGMLQSNNSANRLFVLEHLYDEESEEGEDLTDTSWHRTYPICFGDFLPLQKT
jgi:hypothetical protein